MHGEINHSDSVTYVGLLMENQRDERMSWKEILKFKRRFKKVVRNKKTGRTKTVRYGQAGKAKDGKDRIRPELLKEMLIVLGQIKSKVIGEMTQIALII